jgi:hypothetical protein
MIMAEQDEKKTKNRCNFDPPTLDKADEDVVRRLFGDRYIVLAMRDSGITDVYHSAPGLLFLGQLERFITAVITSPLLLWGDEAEDAWKIIQQWREGTKSPSDEEGKQND